MNKIDGREYFTVAEAVEFMGCSESWIRTLLGAQKFPGQRRIGQRIWLIPVASAVAAKGGLTTRSLGKKHLAKRPAARRKKPKKAASARK